MRPPRPANEQMKPSARLPGALSQIAAATRSLEPSEGLRPPRPASVSLKPRQTVPGALLRHVSQ
jgi:hypothetical protein